MLGDFPSASYDDWKTTPPEWHMPRWLEPDHDHDFDDMADEYCPNCGGEGVVYSCFSEYACIDPEGGCDLCERLCDWCRPRLRALEARERGDG